MRYKLDLTNAALPDWFPDDFPREITVEDGKHQKRFDAILSEKDSDIITLARIKTFGNEGFDYDMPAGFDSPPVGAVLVVID